MKLLHHKKLFLRISDIKNEKFNKFQLKYEKNENQIKHKGTQRNTIQIKFLKINFFI